MDMKFSVVRAAIVLAALIILVDAGSEVSRTRRNRRPAPSRQRRREVRDYLAPPPPDTSYTDYLPQPPPLTPYRPGRLINIPIPSTTEAPGYLSRLASWLNPFGGSPSPPPPPEIPSAVYGPSYPASQRPGWWPPGYSWFVPQPPPPGYLPPHGKNCNPCNKLPWMPLYGVVPSDSHPSSSSDVEIRPSIEHEAKDIENSVNFPSYSYEPRVPDFTHAPQLLPNQHDDVSAPVNVPAGPLPLPHLYPGAMPPLYKAEPFQTRPAASPSSSQPSSTASTHPEVSQQFDQVEVSEVSVGTRPSQPPPDYDSQIYYTPPPGYDGQISYTSPSDSSSGHDSSSDLPFAPSGPEGNDHHSGASSPDSSAATGGVDLQHSFGVHEEHANAYVGGGYRVQGNVDIVKSVPASEYTSSVHYEESPLIDLSVGDHEDAVAKPESTNQGSAVADVGATDEYAVGLNPPPNDPPDSYGNAPATDATTDEALSSSTRDVPKDSYGVPILRGPPSDSAASASLQNGTVFVSTPAFPDIAELPISSDSGKSTPYETYPPSTEFPAPVTRKQTKNSKGPLVIVEPSGGPDPPGGSSTSTASVVDSYRQPIATFPSAEGNAIRTPEPLVPYRPSSLYVPYPPYSGPSQQANDSEQATSSTLAGPTTEEPFLEALLKSYHNFKDEMASQEKHSRDANRTGGPTTWISQPQPSFSRPESINPTVISSAPTSTANEQTQQSPSGGKRNKQVQIIIPYTSQYTPTPFQSAVDDDWSGRGALEETQPRKVPAAAKTETNYVGQPSSSNVVEVRQPQKPLANLLMREVAPGPTRKTSNNSIDVLRLQKNIDNWTIQEYARGMTSSTALPSSAHPYLMPSKNIPREYLTKVGSSAPEARIDTDAGTLRGFNVNDLEREGSASSRVDVSRVQIVVPAEEIDLPRREDFFSSQPTTTTTTTTTVSTTTPASWARLPVSISPHNNEKVYVVTPQPASRLSNAIPSADKKEPADDKAAPNDSEKYAAIEKAYQVLPQAVNNLASATMSAPEDVPLWGIMEHDRYARNDRTDTSTASVPVLYSGHSKVASARH